MNVLCLCARVTPSCCQGPWTFIEYLQPLNTKLMFWEGKRSPVFLCAPAGELIERRVLRLKQLQDKARQLSSPKASWLIWLDSSSQVASLLHEDPLIHGVKRL